MLSGNRIVDIQEHRDHAVDRIRGFAVFLMILCHSLRGIQWGQRPDWSNLAMAMEPLGQVLFLFVLGWSLFLAMDKYQKQSGRVWVKKNGLRVVGLWSLSAFMIYIERGEWQHPVMMQSGFLALAAKSTCLLSILFFCKGKWRWVSAFALGIGLWGITLYLEYTEQWIHGWNAGNGPLLPLAAVAWLGWLTAALYKQKRGLLVFLCLLFIGGSWLGAQGPVCFEWWETTGRQSVAVTLQKKGMVYEVYYYSLRTSLAIFWTGVSISLLLLGRSFRRYSWDPLIRLGQHSLWVYVAHLVLLGAIRLRWGLLDGSWFYALWGMNLFVMIWSVMLQDWIKDSKLWLQKIK